MGVSPDIGYWRRKKIALGNKEVWSEIVYRYQENNNPHPPSLAVLASQNLTEEQVKNIHDRLEAGEKLVVR